MYLVLTRYLRITTYLKILETEMETKPFINMPKNPVPPKLPKHFPDLQGTNLGRNPKVE